jgi:hypothetical protein
MTAVDLFYRRFAGEKKPGISRVFWFKLERVLLDLAFLVDHVLARNGIKFFDFHFFGHGALVFGRGVKVTGASA